MRHLFMRGCYLALGVLLVTSQANSHCHADMVTGSLSSTVPSSVDLTAEGTIDWAVFGVRTPSLSVQERKLGGTQLGGLEQVGVGTPRQFAGFSMVPAFTWTDGTPSIPNGMTTTNGTMPVPAMLVLRDAPGDDSGLRFMVDAPDGVAQRLTVYTQAFEATANITAELTGGPSYTTSYVAGSADTPGILTVDYMAMGPGKTLTFSIGLSDDTSSSDEHSVGIGAVTLSAVPEPSSFLFLGGVGAIAGCVNFYRKRRDAKK